MKLSLPSDWILSEVEDIMQEAHMISNSYLSTLEVCKSKCKLIGNLIDHPEAPSLKRISVYLEKGGYEELKEWDYSVKKFEERWKESLEEINMLDETRRESLRKARNRIQILTSEIKEKVYGFKLLEEIQNYRNRDGVKYLLEKLSIKHKRAVYSNQREWGERVEEYWRRFPKYRGERYPIVKSTTSYDTSAKGHAQLLFMSGEFLFPTITPKTCREKIVENLKMVVEEKRIPIKKINFQRLIQKYSSPVRSPIGGHPEMWEEIWEIREELDDNIIIASSVVEEVLGVEEKLCPPLLIFNFHVYYFFPRRVLENYKSIRRKLKTPLSNPFVRRWMHDIYNAFYKGFGIKTRGISEIIGNITLYI